MSAQEGLVERPCIEALRSYQQADMEGVMVLVSRQAIHEALDVITSLESELAEWKRAASVEAGLRREFCAKSDRLLNDNATLREACKPFATFGELLLETSGFADTDKIELSPEGSDFVFDTVEIGSFRRARAALAGQEQAVTGETLTPVMQAAENAAKRVQGWSQSKREYAERATTETGLRGNCWCEAYMMPEGFSHRPSCTASPGKGAE